MADFRDSKLITLFKLLTKEEVKDFEKWLKSPWANTNEKVQKLFQIIKPFYPKCDDNKLTRDFLFKKLYKVKKNEDDESKRRQFNNIIPQLNRQFEKYFQIKEFEKDELLKRKMLAKRYLENGYTEKGASIIENEIKSLKEKPRKNF